MPREVKNFEEKIKILAKMRAFGVKKLYSVGGNYAVLLPRAWVEVNAMPIDGSYYINLQSKDDGLFISLITEKDLEEITVKEK